MCPCPCSCSCCYHAYIARFAGRMGGPRQRASPAKVEEWLRLVQHNPMGDKLRALRKEHQDLGLPL